MPADAGVSTPRFVYFPSQEEGIDLSPRSACPECVKWRWEQGSPRFSLHIFQLPRTSKIHCPWTSTPSVSAHRFPTYFPCTYLSPVSYLSLFIYLFFVDVYLLAEYDQGSPFKSGELRHRGTSWISYGDRLQIAYRRGLQPSPRLISLLLHAPKWGLPFRTGRAEQEAFFNRSIHWFGISILYWVKGPELGMHSARLFQKGCRGWAVMFVFCFSPQRVIIL